MGNLRPAILLLTAAAPWLVLPLTVLAGCSEPAGGRWKGWVYPLGGDLTVSRELGEFDNFESCKAAALGVVELLDPSTDPTFECGLDCRYSERYGLDVCKETRD